MAVTIKKISNKEALDLVGLHSHEPIPLTFSKGTRVRVASKTGPWKYVCKQGDEGVVEKCAKANSSPIPSRFDLYFVRMDKLHDKVVYLTYEELQVA